MDHQLRTNFSQEAELIDPFLEYLKRTRRINSDSLVYTEFQWFSRRIDLATVTTTRRTSAYEFKLSNNTRALEQASYNCLSFDRSYIVTATRLSERAQEYARLRGVGVFLMESEYRIKLILPASRGIGLLKKLRAELLGAARMRRGALHV